MSTLEARAKSLSGKMAGKPGSERKKRRKQTKLNEGGKYVSVYGGERIMEKLLPKCENRLKDYRENEAENPSGSRKRVKPTCCFKLLGFCSYYC